METTTQPRPVWSFSKSTYKDGPIVTSLRWLRDSTGFAFLSKTASGSDQLYIADVKRQRVRALTPEDQHVTNFDINDHSHLVYSVLSPSIRERIVAEGGSAGVVGTGRKFINLQFPIEIVNLRWYDLNELWAVVDGVRHRIKDKVSGSPLAAHLGGRQLALALSPDGRSLVTALAVSTIPLSWETLYPPPYPSYPFRIRAGRQDPEAADGWDNVSRYVLVDLQNDEVTPLALGPIGNAAGWCGHSRAAWSADSKAVVLANTFLARDAENSASAPDRPCVVIVDLLRNATTCLRQWKGATKDRGYEEGTFDIADMRFDPHDNNRVTLDYIYREDVRAQTYMRLSNGSWTADAATTELTEQNQALELVVRQGINDRPVLVGTDKTTKHSGVILDPNPQLKDVDFGEASVFTWKDKTGRDWVGGLYKPPRYVHGQRYPLVIQTHGFSEKEFVPSGRYPTAFAARELATAGFIVLQVRDCPIRTTPEEGPCQVAGYEAAVEELVAQGLIDRGNVGIVGFSRTCYYVLEALTTSALRFKAASITDGLNEGYFSHIVTVDSGASDEHEGVIGAAPFGKDGLRLWMERSPEFNMDKVATPLQVVANGSITLASMWEPYAALRYLKKPVDLIILRRGTHVLTNPAERIVSQGGTVDWMRFWLQGYEDPDSAKSEQYRRWEELCDMQIEQNRTQTAFCVRSKPH